MSKTYKSADGRTLDWESNSAVIWQTVNLMGYGDQCGPTCVRMCSDAMRVRPAEADYRVDLRPAFTPIPGAEYPRNLRAEMVYMHKPRSGRTAPDKIIVWGLHGAAGTVFLPAAGIKTVDRR